MKSVVFEIAGGGGGGRVCASLVWVPKGLVKEGLAFGAFCPDHQIIDRNFKTALSSTSKLVDF